MILYTRSLLARNADGHAVDLTATSDSLRLVDGIRALLVEQGYEISHDGGFLHDPERPGVSTVPLGDSAAGYRR